MPADAAVKIFQGPAVQMGTMVCQHCGHWAKRTQDIGLCSNCGSGRMCTHCPACFTSFTQREGDRCPCGEQLIRAMVPAVGGLHSFLDATRQEDSNRHQADEAADGASLSMLEAFADPTSATPFLLRQAHMAVQESEKRYRRLMTLMPAIVCELTADGRTLFVSEALGRLTGYMPSELLGKNFWETLVPNGHQQVADDLQARLRTNDVAGYEIELSTKHQSLITIEVNSSNRYRSDGQLQTIIFIGVDVTPYKKAQSALHEVRGQLLRVQDDERRRLARELHDSTAQSLAGLMMNLTVLRELAHTAEDKYHQALNDAESLAESSLREIRTVSFLLHPPAADENGWASALKFYVDGFAKRSGIKATLRLAGRPCRIPADVETAIFRIVQEALMNVHRHTKSATAHIHIRLNGRHVELRVCDAGQGMPAENPDSGLGMASMRERVQELGGKFEVDSTRHGTRIRAIVPLSSTA